MNDRNKNFAESVPELPEVVADTGAIETFPETLVDGYSLVEDVSTESLQDGLPTEPETLPPVGTNEDVPIEPSSKEALPVDVPEDSPAEETKKGKHQAEDFLSELTKMVEKPLQKDTTVADSKEPWDQYAQACAAADSARLSGEPQVVATPCRSTAAVLPGKSAVTPAIPECGHKHMSTPSPRHPAPSPSDAVSPSGTDLPDVGDLSAERPVPGELQLSQNAINLRIHRAMKIDTKGNSKVSEEIRKQFHSKKGKLRLMQVFQSCGFDTDRGLTKRMVVF